MSTTTIDALEPVVRAIAAHGLEAPPRPEPFRPSEAEWSRLVARIRFEGISGLAVESARSGWLVLDEEQVNSLLDVHRGAMDWALRVERKILTVAEAFDAEGIEFAVLKGASLAHTVYAEPCQRPFADADLLVRTRDYERACAVLAGMGLLRRRPEPRPHFEVRFGKASTHRHPDDRIEVDLHRTLVMGPFGLWLDPEELLDRRTTFELAGRQVPRLDDTGMFLNVAMHAALGWERTRLTPLRDMVQVTTTDAVAWDVVERWSRDWRAGAVIDRAITQVRAHLQVELDALPTPAVSRHDRRLVAMYGSRRRDLGGVPLATMRSLEGIRPKAAYVRSLLIPDRTFSESRLGTNRRLLPIVRATIPLRWMVRRAESAIRKRPVGRMTGAQRPVSVRQGWKSR